MRLLTRTLILMLPVAGAVSLAAQRPPRPPAPKVAEHPLVPLPPVAALLDLHAPEFPLAHWDALPALAPLGGMHLDLPLMLDAPLGTMYLDLPLMLDAPLGTMHFDMPPLHDAPLLPLEPALAPMPLLSGARDWSPTEHPRGIASLRPSQNSPEDSLYKAGRSALNRGEYLQAAAIFQELERKYPRSKFAPGALYWQAYALYRVGTIEQLRRAADVLAVQHERYPEAARDADVAALTARIQGALAARGDSRAAQALAARAAQAPTCDKEEQDVRAEALNALVRMDEGAGADLLQRILSRRDECSATLRRRAVYILGRSGHADAAQVLLDVAQNDPSMDVRSDAVSMLGRVQGARTVATLEQIARTNSEERLRRSALSALGSANTSEADAALRRIIDNTSLDDRFRASAVSSLVSGRSEHRNVEELGSYLRGAYPRTTDRYTRQALIAGIARVGGTANEQWLLALVRNEAEESTHRAYALGRLRSASFPIEDVVRLYDSMTERSMRQAVINLLAAREEPAAADKLIDIARRGTDPQVRRSAINALSRKKDPRTTQLLLEMVEKP